MAPTECPVADAMLWHRRTSAYPFADLRPHKACQQTVSQHGTGNAGAGSAMQGRRDPPMRDSAAGQARGPPAHQGDCLVGPVDVHVVAGIVQSDALGARIVPEQVLLVLMADDLILLAGDD